MNKVSNTIGDLVSEQILRPINDSVEDIDAIIGEFSRGISEALKGIDFDAWAMETYLASERLAELGWTLPMTFTAGDLEELAGESGAAEIDDLFEDHYSHDNFKELRRVRADLRIRSKLARWLPLLEECFDSFEAGRHLVTIPALLSVIEGIVAKAVGLDKRISNVAQACASKVAGQETTVTTMMWNSLRIFIEKIFVYAPFGEERPQSINRHWILHGRDETNWTRVDALRLFHALQTIDSLV